MTEPGRETARLISKAKRLAELVGAQDVTHRPCGDWVLQFNDHNPTYVDDQLLQAVAIEDLASHIRGDLEQDGADLAAGIAASA